MSAAQASWPHKGHIAINPAKRKGFVISITVLGAFALLALNQEKIVNHFVTGYEHDLLMPKMSALAAEGKPEAVAWMMLNDPDFRAADTQYTALRKSAEAGHPQSMYLYSKVLKFQKDEVGAGAFLARAAADGYPSAILDLAARTK
ncbi:hypothetical protein [Pseudomonas sp. MWU12-2323]|uniref:hypothetical protein n=1 Tax=Pseudomonas sp. MWU12-2323 TaxID=2651296 RepID=UPI00128DBAFD|nr:hypothetical protein [Pseudomonas sp. MWU12-2323]MPQ71448.1 hypothetical protein [Pseudomonas sp. MWU12-2323]